MFVVMFLVKPKKYIIVPEEFILDLNEQKLRNYGTNIYQKFLVFWSNAALDENQIPRCDYEPNFYLEPTDEFPPPLNIIETCYIGRTIKFFGKYGFLLLFNFSSNCNLV